VIGQAAGRFDPTRRSKVPNEPNCGPGGQSTPSVGGQGMAFATVVSVTPYAFALDGHASAGNGTARLRVIGGRGYASRPGPSAFLSVAHVPKGALGS